MYSIEVIAEKLRPVSESYNLCAHPFMVRFSQGGFDAEQIRWWAKKMLPGSNRFNQSFILATSMCTDVQDRVVLLDNIYSEHGRLEDGKAHVELYMRFMRSIGCKNISVLEDDGSDRIPALAFKRFMVDPNEPLPGILARFLAIETVLPDLFPQYIKGLRRVFAGIDDVAIEYFHIHSELDPEHQADLSQVISRNVHTDAELESVKENFELIYKQLVAMFDYMLLELDNRPWEKATAQKELALA